MFGEHEEVAGGQAELVESSKIFFVLRGDISTQANLEWSEIYFHVAYICDHVRVFSEGLLPGYMDRGGPPPARMNGVMSAYRVHFDRSIL